MHCSVVHDHILRRQLTIVCRLLSPSDSEALRHDWHRWKQMMMASTVESDGPSYGEGSVSLKSIVRRSLRSIVHAILGENPHTALVHYDDGDGDDHCRRHVQVSFALQPIHTDGGETDLSHRHDMAEPIVEIRAVEYRSFAQTQIDTHSENKLVHWLAAELSQVKPSHHRIGVLERVNRFHSFLNGDSAMAGGSGVDDNHSTFCPGRGRYGQSRTQQQQSNDALIMRSSTVDKNGLFCAEPFVLMYRLDQVVQVALMERANLERFAKENMDTVGKRLKEIRDRFDAKMTVIQRRPQRVVARMYGHDAVQDPQVLFDRIMSDITEDGRELFETASSVIGDHDGNKVQHGLNHNDDDDEQQSSVDGIMQKGWMEAHSAIASLVQSGTSASSIRAPPLSPNDNRISKGHDIQAHEWLKKTIVDMLDQIRTTLHVGSYHEHDDDKHFETQENKHMMLQDDRQEEDDSRDAHVHVVRINHPKSSDSFGQYRVISDVYRRVLDAQAKNTVVGRAAQFDLGSIVATIVRDMQKTETLIQDRLGLIYDNMHPHMERIERHSYRVPFRVDKSQRNAIFGISTQEALHAQVQEVIESNILTPLKERFLKRIQDGIKALEEDAMRAKSVSEQPFEHANVSSDGILSEELDQFREWLSIRDGLMQRLAMISRGILEARTKVTEKILFHRRIRLKHVVRLAVEIGAPFPA